MKPTELRKQIESGETGPLYLLEAGDRQSRHELALEFTTLVDEGLQAFNVQTFHANEAATTAARDQLIGDILAAARTLPMMAPRRVLIVHAAERLLSPRKGKDDEEEAPAQSAADRKRRKSLTPLEEFEHYLASPEVLTTLVFVADALDANRRLVKVVRKHAAAVDCGALATAAEASRWIEKRVAQDGLSIEPRATAVLLETTGLNLGRIRAEVDKLVLYAAGDQTVTVRHVKDLIVPQDEPGEDFALGRAIWNDNARAALREIAAQLDGGALPVMVLGQIRAAVGRLRPDDRITRALDAVFRTDLDIKSSAGEPRYLLERLVIEICTRR